MHVGGPACAASTAETQRGKHIEDNKLHKVCARVSVQGADLELNIRQAIVNATAARSRSVGEAKGHSRKAVPALVLDAFQTVILPVQHSATYMPGTN